MIKATIAGGRKASEAALAKRGLAPLLLTEDLSGLLTDAVIAETEENLVAVGRWFQEGEGLTNRTPTPEGALFGYTSSQGRKSL